MGKNQHVVPNKNGSGWSVKGEGNTKSTKITETKKEAINKAREISRNQESELVIHGKDGKIQSKDSHSNDPKEIKG